MSKDKQELWLTEYVTKECYVDQTGLSHPGTIVWEQIIVYDTGERVDINDGYSVHKDHGRIYECVDGRKFQLWTETVDYSGGTHVKTLFDKPPGQEKKFWRRINKYNSAKGFVYPDRSAPVVRLIEE